MIDKISFIIGYYIGVISLAFFLMLSYFIDMLLKKIRSKKQERSQSNEEGKDL